MTKKWIAVLLTCLLLFGLSIPAIACCEGEPPGNPDCYKCEDGAWVLKDWAECGTDSHCTGDCHGDCVDCECEDDDTECTGCDVCEDGECVWDCPQDYSCCDTTCYDPDVKKCCTDSVPYYLCNLDQICCYGICCEAQCCWYFSNGTLVPYCCESGGICCIDECLTCPTQSASGVAAYCGILYGGKIQLCYSGAENWWFVENVTQGPATCGSSGFSHTTEPFQKATGCVTDIIANGNGPPTAVGPCYDITYQTVYCGPTQEKVYCCSYENAQIIIVSSGSSPGTVITASAGAQVECSY